MRYLLVIDVQNGFVSDRTKHILPKLSNLFEEFKNDCILATKFINLEKSPFGAFLHWERLKSKPETDLIDFVQDNATQIFVKHAYSSCTPELMQYLKENDIQEVYVVGIDTDCCVLKTAIDLFECNIRPIVLADCCASNGGEESHRAAITVLERTIGRNQIAISNRFD